MKRKARKVNRGARPPDKVISEMRTRGYALAAVIAKELEVAPTTVYDWVANDRLVAPAGDRRPVKVKLRGCLWILIAAARAHVELPAAAS